MNFKKLIYLLNVIPSLGFYNVVYALYYKISLKSGFRKKAFKTLDPIKGPFFSAIKNEQQCPEIFNTHLIILKQEFDSGILTYFSKHKFAISDGRERVGVPDWFFNPFTSTKHSQSKLHWTEINDFGEGDIKIIWELSRFDWVTQYALTYKKTGNEKYLTRLNLWLEDWSQNNPLNIGPNWKCGQETSFRVMKLLTSAFLLNQLERPCNGLKDMIYQHVCRIEGNLQYGVIQDNNHGSSEAIGLYIGAAWLIHTGKTSQMLLNWKNKGRKLLEERILKLIQAEGSFSQRSMNYHRVMVDTLSFCLHMMEVLNEIPFDQVIKNRLISLGEWQYKMTFGQGGEAPNYGSNDGSRIENLYSNDYADYRPSTQLFFALLTKERVYDEAAVSEAMYWRCGNESLSYPIRNIPLPKGEILDKHILLLRNQKASLFLKIPDATFRPGNDVFHIDLWVDGKPILIDAGTFSYNSVEWTDKLKSISSHNSVQFDDCEPMPKLSRFLNGCWISPLEFGSIVDNNETLVWEGSYRDYRRNEHKRKVVLGENALEVFDITKSQYSSNYRFHFSKVFNIPKYETAKAFNSEYYLEIGESSLIELKKEKRGNKRSEVAFKVHIGFDGTVEYNFMEPQ